MKNIHVLPTDKPSRRLVLFNGTYRVEKGIMNYPKEMYPSPQGYDIYITNDEEIKDVRPHKDKWQLEKGSILNKFPNYLTDLSECKLVIMTTNQDLIKDGVQAIDDEFLEWFVKNPSCKEVEIINWFGGMYPCKYKIIIPKEEPKQEREMFLMNANETIDTRSTVEKMKPLQEQWQKDMEKSLNPKQEPVLKCDICKMYPRLEGTNKCEGCYSVVRHVLEQDPRFKDTLLPELRKKQETPSVGAEKQIFKIVLDEKWRPNKVSMIETDNNSVLNKQETLEEAAKKYATLITKKWIKGDVCNSEKEDIIVHFVSGAKWQQEQDKNKYSEEDLISLLEFNYKKETNQLGTLRKDYSQKIVREWFEQFKKK